MTVAKPAVHAAGEPQYYDGHELVAAGDPITDAQGNLTFDAQGNVPLWAAVDLIIDRRELLSVGSGTVKLQTTPISGLKVYVAGVADDELHDRRATMRRSRRALRGRRTAWSSSTRAPACTAAASRSTSGPTRRRPGLLDRRHLHGQRATKFLLGNEPMLFGGGEQLYYLTSDPQQVVQDEQRILVKGVGGMPGSIHYFGIDDVNLFLGGGARQGHDRHHAHRHHRRRHRRRRTTRSRSARSPATRASRPGRQRRDLRRLEGGLLPGADLGATAPSTASARC